MKHKNFLILGATLLMTASSLSATPDDNDGARQTLTINEETENRTVSEIKIDGNNAVLLFTDGSTLAVDMRLVTLTMSYDETTGIVEMRNEKGERKNNGVWYTLDGRKLSLQPKQKGVYIQNGKKVVNKKK